MKIKAWDKQQKKIVNVNMILLSTDPQEIDYDGNNNEPKSIEHFELMRYIGIKDKGGVEVYEGYIVKFEDNIMRVKWLAPSFFYVPYCGIARDSMSIVEIIGNIYENPELLKEEK